MAYNSLIDARRFPDDTVCPCVALPCRSELLLSHQAKTLALQVDLASVKRPQKICESVSSALQPTDVISKVRQRTGAMMRLAGDLSNS